VLTIFDFQYKLLFKRLPMSQSPDNLQIESWHRFFAMQANNAAWDLSESSGEVLNHPELLDAAHASAWHWRVIGTELHQMRSVMLLALVHARMNMGPSAWAYAEKMKNFFEAKSDTPDWEMAFVHTIYALAAHANARMDEFQLWRERATESLAALKDPEDRSVVEKTFNLIPKN
jgi:hypothetical protein